MRPRLRLFALLGWLGALAVADAATPSASSIVPSSQQRLANGQQVLVLGYHDVVTSRQPGGDTETVDTATLAAHLNWLRSEGYQAIGLDALLAAYAGSARLPDKAVLLTFDDGYESLYTQVYPLLRAFRVPAVAALVGRWMEIPAGQPVPYSERAQRAREEFISWDQAREMQASGLVEFASHSWDLHHGIAGNPAGSLQPAATTHAFVAGAGYESDAAWTQRVRSDLERQSTLMAQQLGQRPRAIVWPYGRYNATTEAIANELGMPIGLTLDSGRSQRAEPIGRIRRLLVDGNPAAVRLAQLVRQVDGAPTVRFVRLDLDRLADSHGADLERRISELLDHIRRLGVETVVIAAFAHPPIPGRIESVYFPNRHLPVRADLLNRVAWTIATTTQAGVLAWLPADGLAPDGAGGDAPAQQTVGDLFEDLGKAVYLQGLLLSSTREDEPLEALSARAARLAERTRAWQPQLITALNVRGPAPRPEQISALLDGHDYVQVDLPAAGHGSDDLLAAIRSITGAAPRALICLAAPSGSATDVGARALTLQSAGFPNLGVAGADLDSPAELEALRRTLSLRSLPAQAALAHP